MRYYDAIIENLRVVHDQLRRLDQFARDPRSKELIQVMFETRDNLETHIKSEQQLQENVDAVYNTSRIDHFVQHSLEQIGCEITSAAGIWTVKSPSGETWDFTTPTKKEARP
jgi:hypothetical protein